MRKSFARIVPMIAVCAFAAACTDQITQPVQTARVAPVDTFASARASIDTFASARPPIDTLYVSQRAPIDTFALARPPIDTLY